MNIPQELVELLKRMERSLFEICELLAGQVPESQLDDGDVWLDKQQVMQLLNISDRSLFTMRKEGKLTPYAIRGKWYYRLSDIKGAFKR
jgi:hypothetical protein